MTLSVLLSSVLAIGAGYEAWEQHREAVWIATTAALALAAVAIAIAISHRRVTALLGPVTTSSARSVATPGLTLFLASFAALFLEMVLIRYTGSQLRIFSFYRNIPLIAAYLGLGLGCALGRGRPTHVLWLLLWCLPLLVFLSAGSLILSGILGRIAAIASSEHILGDAVVAGPSFVVQIFGQLGMGAFCVATLFALASFFVPIGRLLGDAFERLPRLTAYSINIVGSLAGTCAFLLLGYYWSPPWVWVLIGLVPLLWWLEDGRQMLVAVGLILASALALVPSVGETIWSPYQKLVGQQLTFSVDAGGPEIPGYMVDISDVFYQVAVDLRPEAVAAIGTNPFPHYDEAFRSLAGPPGRVLIVGAGTGNDVAAALRAGATQVDAVDIDPAIVTLGRRHHPEHPYDDPRVHVIVDDARAAFRRLPAASYDAVVFGLLDSHTQLGMSSVRLDNYVFTRESFAAARRLLRAGGSMVVTAATFRDWFRQRFVDLLETTCGSPVQTKETQLWVTYTCTVGDAGVTSSRPISVANLPSDDWPFLYLPTRSVPQAYALVVIMLLVGSVLVVRAQGLTPTRFSAYHAHLFFLGAAFLLMEVYSINRMALLFGTTWMVSAVAVMVVLTLIIAANVTVALVGGLPYAIAYVGLATSVLVSFALDPAIVLGHGVGASVVYGFVVLLPVYFAGLVFARSFARRTRGRTGDRRQHARRGRRRVGRVREHGARYQSPRLARARFLFQLAGVSRSCRSGVAESSRGRGPIVAPEWREIDERCRRRCLVTTAISVAIPLAANGFRQYGRWAPANACSTTGAGAADATSVAAEVRRRAGSPYARRCAVRCRRCRAARYRRGDGRDDREARARPGVDAARLWRRACRPWVADRLA